MLIKVKIFEYIPRAYKETCRLPINSSKLSRYIKRMLVQIQLKYIFKVKSDVIVDKGLIISNLLNYSLESHLNISMITKILVFKVPISTFFISTDLKSPELNEYFFDTDKKTEKIFHFSKDNILKHLPNINEDLDGFSAHFSLLRNKEISHLKSIPKVTYVIEKDLSLKEEKDDNRFEQYFVFNVMYNFKDKAIHVLEQNEKEMLLRFLESRIFEYFKGTYLIEFSLKFMLGLQYESSSNLLIFFDKLLSECTKASEAYEGLFTHITTARIEIFSFAKFIENNFKNQKMIGDSVQGFICQEFGEDLYVAIRFKDSTISEIYSKHLNEAARTTGFDEQSMKMHKILFAKTLSYLLQNIMIE